MTIDIYLREKNGSREIRFPWLPERISFETGEANMASYEIIGLGEVAIPTGVALASYSWESEFPGKNRIDSGLLHGEWQDPQTYHNILLDWKAKAVPLNLLVTGYPINDDVILSDYTGEASGAFGDIVYQIKLIKKRNIVIASETTQDTETDPDPEPERPETESSTTSYTIKSGDTLWKIAKRFLGKGSRWKEIYELNKDIIESVAKERWRRAGKKRDSENGHWIFPGTVIKIPQ